MVPAKKFLLSQEGYADLAVYYPKLDNTIQSLMIAFARFHVEQALEARDRLYQTHFAEEVKWTEDNIKFIKGSYPLTNIK